MKSGWSSDFPALNAWSSSHSGGYWDAFVSKFSSSGSLLWSTFLGGSDDEMANELAVDSQNSIIIIGSTYSIDFPAVHAPAHNGGHDAFLSKFSSNGSLSWSTFLGGSHDDEGLDLTVDQSDSIIIAGKTVSTDFPLVNARDSENDGVYDIFVAKLTSNRSLLWSTLLGGSDDANDAETRTTPSPGLLVALFSLIVAVRRRISRVKDA